MVSAVSGVYLLRSAASMCGAMMRTVRIVASHQKHKVVMTYMSALYVVVYHAISMLSELYSLILNIMRDVHFLTELHDPQLASFSQVICWKARMQRLEMRMQQAVCPGPRCWTIVSRYAIARMAAPAAVH